MTNFRHAGVLTFKPWEKLFLTAAALSLVAIPVGAHWGWWGTHTLTAVELNDPANFTQFNAHTDFDNDGGRTLASDNTPKIPDDFKIDESVPVSTIRAMSRSITPVIHNWFEGKITEADRHRKAGGLRTSFGTTTNKKYKDAFDKIYAAILTQEIEVFEHRLIIRKAMGASLRSSDIAKLKLLNQTPEKVDKALTDAGSRMRMETDVLISKGASYNADDDSWDLTKMGYFEADALRNSPKLFTALTMIADNPILVSMLADPNRKDMVPFGGTVFLPPRVYKARGPKKLVRAITMKSWVAKMNQLNSRWASNSHEVEVWMPRANNWFNHVFTSGKALDSAINFFTMGISGAIENYTGTTMNQTHLGQTEAEIALESAFDGLTSVVAEMKVLGVPKQTYQQLQDQLQEYYSADSEQLLQLAKDANPWQVRFWESAAWRVVLTPGIIALAGFLTEAFVGAEIIVGGTTITASSAQFAVATMFMLPVGLAGGLTVYTAWQESKANHTGFGEELIFRLPGTMADAAFTGAEMSLLPVIGFGIIPVATALGASATVASSAYVLFNIGQLGYFTYSAAVQAPRESGVACRDAQSALDEVKNSTTDTDALARASAKMNVACAKYGVDITFALVTAAQSVFTLGNSAKMGFKDFSGIIGKAREYDTQVGLFAKVLGLEKGRTYSAAEVTKQYEALHSYYDAQAKSHPEGRQAYGMAQQQLKLAHDFMTKHADAPNSPILAMANGQHAKGDDNKKADEAPLNGAKSAGVAKAKIQAMKDKIASWSQGLDAKKSKVAQELARDPASMEKVAEEFASAKERSGLTDAQEREMLEKAYEACGK